MIGCTCYVCTSPDSKDKRLRSSILVQSKNTTIVIDATPDFRQQMLRENVMGIDAVLLTHPHKDHLGGLDDTRAFQFFQQRPTAIYGNKISLDGVRQELFYAFAEKKYPGVPVIDLHPIELTPFSIGDIPIIPIQVFHHKMPVYGYRFGPFTYITDANRIEESEKEKIRGSDVMVVNALRREPHISHFTLNEAIALAQELQIPQTYFTHASHQLGTHEEVNAELPSGIQMAYDGLTLHF